MITGRPIFALAFAAALVLVAASARAGSITVGVGAGDCSPLGVKSVNTGAAPGCLTASPTATATATPTSTPTATATSSPTSTPTAVSPGGSNTQVQFNNAGAFGGDSDFTYSGDVLTLGSAGASTSAMVWAKTISGSTATDNWLGLTGTFPFFSSVTGGLLSGVYFNLTTVAGSAVSDSNYAGLRTRLNAGKTSNQGAWAVVGENATASGCTDTGMSPWSTLIEHCIGVAGTSNGGGGASHVGVYADGGNGTNNYGLIGTAYSGGTTVGVWGGTASAGSSISYGGWFASDTTAPATAKAGLAASNGATTQDIFRAYDNSTLVFTIADGGDFKAFRTNTAGGTTGDQTINRPQGSVNVAASASSITVTNSLVSATSNVAAVAQRADATCAVRDVVPGSGSVAIHMTATCTAETRVAFWVWN